MVYKELDIVRFIRGQRKLNILVDSVTVPAQKFNIKNTKKAIINLDTETQDLESSDENKKIKISQK